MFEVQLMYTLQTKSWQVWVVLQDKNLGQVSSKGFEVKASTAARLNTQLLADRRYTKLSPEFFDNGIVLRWIKTTNNLIK